MRELIFYKKFKSRAGELKGENAAKMGVVSLFMMAVRLSLWLIFFTVGLSKLTPKVRGHFMCLR
jgi:hypothetical protein